MQRLIPSFPAFVLGPVLLGAVFMATPGQAHVAQDGDAPPFAGAATPSQEGAEGEDAASGDAVAEGDAPADGDSVFMPPVAPEPAPSSMPSLTLEPSDVVGSPTDATEPPPEAERITFLVTEVEVSGEVGLAPEDARDLLANRFGRLQDKVEVRSMGDVKTSLDKAALMAALGGDDSEISALTGMLDVDRVVYGRIARVGSVIDIGVRVVNVRDANVEMAMSRRLKAGSDPSLTLAVLDRQADKLLAWVLETYTDGAPSAEFTALKKKKLKPRKTKEDGEGVEVNEAEPAPIEPPPDTGMDFRFTWLGLLGGTTAGLGLGLIAAAGAASAAGSFTTINESTLPFLTEGSVAVGGAVLLGLGIGIIVADHYIFE
jgi:hypothetical protein